MGKTVNRIEYNVSIHQQDSSLPVLLLLHGFMGSGKAFDHLITPLSEFCNPVTVDLLGHGKTEKPGNADRFSLTFQLEDLHQIIRKLHASPIFLHGYSMGGRLALRFALKHPGLLKGLILESTNFGLPTSEQKSDRKKIDEERARHIETDFHDFLDKWQQMPLFNNGVEIPGELSQQYRQIQESQESAAMANSLRGFGTAQMPSVRKELFRLSMPTLLIAGEHDEKYRKILSEMEKLIPRNKFHIIKDAGHRVHLENPGVFLAKVKAFVLCTSSC